MNYYCPKIICLGLVFLIACKKEETRVINFNQLEERNHIYYEIKSEVPFSGIAIKYFPNGESKEAEMEFYRGIHHGKTFGWFSSGQTEYDIDYYESIPKVMKQWDESGRVVFRSFRDDDVVLFPEMIIKLAEYHISMYNIYESYGELFGKNSTDNPYYYFLH